MRTQIRRLVFVLAATAQTLLPTAARVADELAATTPSLKPLAAEVREEKKVRSQVAGDGASRHRS